MVRAPAWQPPAEFDDYVLARPLGQGRMGEVYLAEDVVLARPVAIKFLTASASAAARQRFLFEARAAARLSHPNVVAVYRVGELDQRPYLISEFVRGRTLDQLERPLPFARILEIAVDLSRALAAAHRAGVLHRDLKPQNAIVADDGCAKLLDFGLATLLEPTSGSAEPQASAGGIVGTPDYIAPEVWRAEPASRRSDVYSLGAVLYQLQAGHAPHAGVPLDELPRVVQVRDAPPVGDAAADADPRFAALLARCLARDPAARFGSGDEVRAALEQLARTSAGVAIPAGNPYRGLSPFEAAHRALFFGRSAEIGVVLDRMRNQSFLLVAGESGVGKSSLCRAGVLPAVAEGALGGGRSFACVMATPGRRPLAALAAALAGPLGMAESELLNQLGGGRDALVALSRRLGASQGILLLFDQLEELLTVSQWEEAALVVQQLAAVGAGASAIKIVATIRADFLSRLASATVLGEELPRFLYFLRPLPIERVRDVIVGPAEATGIAFASEQMIESLARATAASDGSLPLLQFALAQLWDARDRSGQVIPEAALASLGGVAGALARHADGVLQALLPAQRRLARHMLLQLVTAEDTRVCRSEAELAGGEPSARATLDALVRGRLLHVRESEDGSAYELAHDILIRGWGTLRSWLDEDGDGRLVRERLLQAAAEWERLGRASDALWSPRQLAELDALHQSAEGLPAGARAFVARSRRTVRLRRLSRWGAALALPALAAALYAGVTVQARRHLDERVGRQLASASVALQEANRHDESGRAARETAFALFDRRQAATAEPTWARALVEEAAADADYRTAAQELEAALMQDPTRSGVRGRLGDVLLRRALLAERTLSAGRRDELAARLALYDADGHRRAALNQPAWVGLETSPAGARVTIERAGGEPGAAHALVTPIHRALAPGSYVFHIEAPGRATVRLPVLAGHGETLRIAADLPAAEQIPSDFVFIPAGRFRFGSAADEDARRGFLAATPLHEISTGAFLIARHEVTFADWLAYLRALPAAERAERLPYARNFGTGMVRLEPAPGGRFRLTIEPSGHAYHAEEGELIRYPGRRRRAAVDWRRLPVLGISARDAEAYLGWLDRSGRVPGARLCSEHEWERAARGADGRDYPHGRALTPEDADYDETYDHDPFALGPDEVGSHPDSRSPFGLDDMSGNAFEWTTSVLEPGAYVLRGGSYFHDRRTSQTANRAQVVPTLRDATLGVRVCAQAPGGSRAAGERR